MQQFRETIWGIHPKYRRWFQFLTLLGVLLPLLGSMVSLARWSEMDIA